MTTWQILAAAGGGAALAAGLVVAAVHGGGVLLSRRVDRWRLPLPLPPVCSSCEARLPAGGELCDTCRAVFDDA